MSASTLTHTILASTYWGDKKVVIDQVTFSAGYVTDGFAITPANVGMAVIEAVIPVSSGTKDQTTYAVANWSSAAKKLLLLGGADATVALQQFASDAAITATAVTLLIIGK